MGRLMCWWSPWRSEKRTRFIGVCDWKNQAVLLLCHTTVLVFWKIIESKLNNTLPGTNEMTVVENWFYCSVLRLSDTIFFSCSLSWFSAIWILFVSLCFPCSFVPSMCAHTHTCIHTSQKNVEKFPRSRAPSFPFRGAGRWETAQDFGVSIAAACWWGKLSLRSPFSEQHVSTTIA